MFKIIQHFIECLEYPSSDIVRMIRSEYKNAADQEFVLKFFKTHNALPNLKEFYRD